jgi:serine/threonine protein kinase
VAEDGRPKIADFGIANLNAPDLPQTGRTLGTPAYMSPEQLKGDAAVDGRSDLFSLGVVLYQLLTRHRPFQGNSTLIISFKVLNREPVPATALNAELSPELGHVIARAIAKDPSQRYQTGMEMALDLQGLRGSIRPPSSDDTPQVDHGRDPANWNRIISFTSTLGVAVKIARSRGEKDSQSNAVPLSQPWQQLSISFLTLGFLALAFVGLWQVIPINAAHVAATASVLPDRPKEPLNSSTGLPTVSEHAPDAKASSTKRGRPNSLSGRVPSDSPGVVQMILEGGKASAGSTTIPPFHSAHLG